MSVGKVYNNHNLELILDFTRRTNAFMKNKQIRIK